MKQKAVPLAAAALVALALAGCSGEGRAASPTTTKAATDGFVDGAGYAAALKESAKAYRWPADFTPDLGDLASKSGPPPRARISAGGEKTVLEIVNKCAWYLSWDAARTAKDATGERAALDVMRDVLPTYGAADPSGQELATNAARQAALGDPTLARQYVRANCDATKFLSS